MQVIILITGLFSIFLNGEEKEVDNYIHMYGPVAVAEMRRTGVPASIKLAQAILESRHGTSNFAIKARNHFGIKCKTYWKGKTYYHVDDDKNPNGQLVESCFRAYEAVIDSYVDHSNFLRQSITYGPLFLLNKEDYNSWAKGLQKEGYATDKNYAKKLVRIIENYELYHFDKL